MVFEYFIVLFCSFPTLFHNIEQYEANCRKAGALVSQKVLIFKIILLLPQQLHGNCRKGRRIEACVESASGAVEWIGRMVHEMILILKNNYFLNKEASWYFL